MSPREPNLADRYQRPYGMPRPAPTAVIGAMDRAPATKPRRQRKGAGSRPNAAVTAEYQKRLDFLVLSMHTSVLYWMRAAYRAHEPVMAQDGEVFNGTHDDSGNHFQSLYPRRRNRDGNVSGGHDGTEKPSPAMTLLTEAQQYDRMGYSLGLRDVRIVPDRSKWHSFYDFGRDRIVTEGKFWAAPAAERLHMILHEIGHRGQDADRSAYEAFKRLHLNNIHDFEAMANPVHLHDERDGHLHDIAEEVWAESYARWCLGLPMPAELREFWDERGRGGVRGMGADTAGRDSSDCVAGDINSACTMAMDARPPPAFLKEASKEGVNARDNRSDGAHNVGRVGLDASMGVDMSMDRTLAEQRESLNVRCDNVGAGPGIRSHDSGGAAWDGDIGGLEDGGFAADARSPAVFLKAAFARLRKRWEERFDDAALKLARWFAQSAAMRSDERLRRILKDGGVSVKFTPTKAMRDVMEGTVQANVALIKSIPQEYLTKVEGAVMRSVQTGRDLGQLSKELYSTFRVTKRRAAFIALDQNNKATSALTRARQMELGTQATWRHSHAGKEPRPTHVANDGKPYDPVTGWWDPAVKRYIWPGTEPGCRCWTQTVIPGFKP